MTNIDPRWNPCTDGLEPLIESLVAFEESEVKTIIHWLSGQGSKPSLELIIAANYERKLPPGRIEFLRRYFVFCDHEWATEFVGQWENVKAALERFEGDALMSSWFKRKDQPTAANDCLGDWLGEESIEQYWEYSAELAQFIDYLRQLNWMLKGKIRREVTDSDAEKIFRAQDFAQKSVSFEAGFSADMDLRDLCHELVKREHAALSQNEIARRFCNGDEKKAQRLLARIGYYRRLGRVTFSG